MVSAEKLRGGFYTPPGLVRACLDRVGELVGDRSGLTVLEPSSGDGAFIRGLARHRLADQVSRVTAFEIIGPEAEKCRAEGSGAGFDLDVITGSVLNGGPALGRGCDVGFDVALGNPPFVRFQFVTADDVAGSGALAERLGLSFAGVSNLWLPVFLAALSALREGGVFAFVVPAEFFTGVSARVARQWLTDHVMRLRVDLFAPGSFPRVMQEVVVVSGLVHRPALVEGSVGAKTTAELLLEEHGAGGRSRRWRHSIDRCATTWTGYLLKPEQLDILGEVRCLPDVAQLGDLAKFEVATVTGANEFFTVDEATVEEYEMRPWALPLLPRVRHAPGLRFTGDDYASLKQAHARAYLLNFAADSQQPTEVGVRRYLSGGDRDGLPERYKCRIREPWYRVPVVPPGTMMLSKRSHRFPRVILNCVGAYTTDTIYRGRMLSASGRVATDLVAAFHNSMTLLTAEIEGRSFGGGVLELVPSEVGRLLVAVPEGFGTELERLDGIARSESRSIGAEAVIEETDGLLAKRVPGLDPSALKQLREARLLLIGRRMDRNASA
jgi:adenine-specific DNA-methyltransferase